MMKKVPLLILACCAVLLVCGSFSHGAGDADPVVPEWQPEFNAVCAGTPEAMNLTVQELEEVLNRCSQLVGRIEQLDSGQAKFYRKRLALACNLYRFVLDEKLAASERGTPSEAH